MIVKYLEIEISTMHNLWNNVFQQNLVKSILTNLAVRAERFFVASYETPMFFSRCCSASNAAKRFLRKKRSKQFRSIRFVRAKMFNLNRLKQIFLTICHSNICNRVTICFGPFKKYKTLF